jgi:hypothetical protein
MAERSKVLAAKIDAGKPSRERIGRPVHVQIRTNVSNE